MGAEAYSPIQEKPEAVLQFGKGNIRPSTCTPKPLPANIISNLNVCTLIFRSLSVPNQTLSVHPLPPTLQHPSNHNPRNTSLLQLYKLYWLHNSSAHRPMPDHPSSLHPSASIYSQAYPIEIVPITKSLKVH